METKNQKIKTLLGDKSTVLKNAEAFINSGKIMPISIGGELLKDGRFFQTISYTEGNPKKAYQLKEVGICSIDQEETVLEHAIEASIPDANIVCHEAIVGECDFLSFIYLLEV